MQPDFSRLEEAYARAIELVPSVEGAQVDAKAAVFSMTADGYPLVGWKARTGMVIMRLLFKVGPFDKNYWVSTGFLDGVSSGGGIGK